MTYVGQHYKKSDLEKRYDAIVIGSGMGGLSVSSVLAQKGKRVLLLEQHNIIGGCTHAYARNGYEWNIGLHYVGAVHSPKTTTRKMFDYITQSGVEWAPMPEVYNRVIIGDKEYPFVQGTENYIAGLKNAFPEDHEAIDKYMELLKTAVRSSAGFFALKTMPKDMSDQMHDQLAGTFLEYSNKTTYEVLSELTDNKELIAVICGNYGDYSLPPKQSAFAMHAMLVKHYIESASYPVGGAASLAKSIVPVIENAGGRVVYSAEVQELLIEGDAVTGVRLANGDEILSDIVVSNAGVNNTFAKLIPESSPFHESLSTNLK
ncbi:MAG: NAD(P)/FAD-dependent oxidoreductase, partial [Pseudomonadota bacterium]|nr:NAD(P)/FAD-dependent oxidoreductase [Pseudomonadota bacterium]